MQRHMAKAARRDLESTVQPCAQGSAVLLGEHSMATTVLACLANELYSRTSAGNGPMVGVKDSLEAKSSWCRQWLLPWIGSDHIVRTLWPKLV